MAKRKSNTGKNAGESETLTEPLPTKLTTSGESRTETLSPPEPKPYDWMNEWLSDVIGQGVEVAHVFCEIDTSELAYSIGSHRVSASIGSRNFVILEIPNDPMDGSGYRVFSKGA